VFTNALNDNCGNFEKKSIHPSLCYNFLKFRQKSHILQKVQRNQPNMPEPKTIFFSYSQPLGPKEHSPGCRDHQICEEKAKSPHPNEYMNN